MQPNPYQITKFASCPGRHQTSWYPLTSSKNRLAKT